MGINTSRLKFKKSDLEQLPTFDSTSLASLASLDDEKALEYYLSDKVSDADRLHMFTFFKKYLFQSYFTPPIEDKLIQGCKLLDVACGPGTWLLCMSNKYENSNFIGLDIKPLFPQEIKPKNLEFIEADIFDGLPFPDNEFDFVHQETMTFIFTREQWDFVFSELIRVTKPGGYIEIVEFYVTCVNTGSIFYKLYQGLYTSCLKRNVDIKLVNSLDSILESHSSITTVNRDERKVILGPNGGKVGTMVIEMFTSFYIKETTIDVLSIELGMSKEEYKNMVEKDLVEELKDTNPEILYIRFWAQKINNN